MVDALSDMLIEQNDWISLLKHSPDVVHYISNEEIGERMLGCRPTFEETGVPTRGSSSTELFYFDIGA